MSPRQRAVSTYLQTFLLISVALGASFLVYSTVQSYSAGASGPGVSVSSPSIRFGDGTSLETLTISDTGSGTITGITILTPGASPTASYCYSLADPVNDSLMSATCPALSRDPTRVQIERPLPPGGSEVVVLTVIGAEAFKIGVTYQVTVMTSSAAQATVSVVVVPA